MINKFKEAIFSKTTKAASLIFTGNMSSSFFGIIFTIFAARLLGPENWGLVAAVGSLMTIFVAFGDLGIGANFFQFASGKRESDIKGVSRLYKTSFFLKIVTAFTSLGLIYVLSPLLSQIIFASNDTFLVLVSALGAFGVLLLEFQVFAIESKRLWGKAAFLSSLTNFFRLIFILILASYGTINLANVLIVFTASSLLAFLVSLIWLFEAPRLDKGWTRLFRTSAGFSGWMSTNKIVSTLNSRIDILLLVSLAGAYEAGIYGAASRLSIGVPLIMGSLATVFATNYASLAGESLVAYFKKSVVLSGIVACGLVLGIIIITPLVIALLGDGYRQSGPVLQWLFVAFLPFVLATPAVNLLIYHFKKPAIVAILSLIQLPLTLIVNYLYISSLGVFAPVIAIALANTMTLLVSYIFVFRLLKR
ncbi:MAG: hypothetical protein A3F61_00605 [Candidatus Blackburnbacteria bacterium RIFCSPHIGHO2_12_FULL_41_13b]|uniref:Polysaccharide biosynthesis protein C-terminal domain-containing protein n=1 Tax=Candidatus Blackburnbacteria bacterium RIFCSPHIGHO2_12_FULL_41_13b TaxID=1797517 RepID=A0A1G1VC47_9BACT|nr:MAG: hypothetical protein A3F61_00605 [Candidatus Blackburnbacteria bacterium RIFCSPHIGHO2_12_FULL_41_13b]